MSDNDKISAPQVEETDALVSQDTGVSETDVNTEQSSDAQTDVKSPDKAADPSKAEGVKQKPETMLSKVQEALEKKSQTAEEKSPVSEEEETEKTDEEKAEQKTDEAKADPEKDKPDVPKEFAKHPAWQRIIKERDSFKADASAYRNISTFMAENKISGKDAADALKLTSLAYKDPVEFLKRIDALANNVRMQIGEVLPPDLKEEVEGGLLSEDRAKELSLARNQVSVNQRIAEQSQQQLAQVDDEQELQARERIFDGWAGATSKTDPDLSKKLPLMQGELLKLNHQFGAPQTHEEMVDRLKYAHNVVTQTMRSLVPQKQATQQSPKFSGNSANVKTEPKSMLDAVEAALNRRR
jgi:hypothetical protein